MSTEQVYAENEVLELSSVEEAELNELAKDVETQVIEGRSGIQATNLVGRMRNSTPRGPLTLLHRQVWEGNFVVPPPRTINRASTGNIAQTNLTNGPCEAAVVYIGRNQQNRECGWLFAFLNARGGQRKVYAQCGPRSRFTNINWGDIRTSLAGSSSRTSVTDRATGTRVTAQMTGTTGQSITTAAFN